VNVECGGSPPLCYGEGRLAREEQRLPLLRELPFSRRSTSSNSRNRSHQQLSSAVGAAEDSPARRCLAGWVPYAR